MNETPKDFDWVKARSECSAVVIFKKLGDDVKKNVDDMNALDNSDKPRFSFIVGEGLSQPFSVHSGEAYIRFVLDQEAGRIKIESNWRVFVITATPTLTGNGNCKLRVNESELERWQFVRMVLQDFFFNSPMHR